jgi:mRNA export factor
VACFPDKSGFALGSIEGRITIQYTQNPESRNFAFKCHRNDKARPVESYAVNAISFHPNTNREFTGTFATAGGDGCVSFWDKDDKERLKLFARVRSLHFNFFFVYYMSLSTGVKFNFMCGNQFYGENLRICC